MNPDQPPFPYAHDDAKRMLGGQPAKTPGQVAREAYVGFVPKDQWMDGDKGAIEHWEKVAAAVLATVQPRKVTAEDCRYYLPQLCVNISAEECAKQINALLEQRQPTQAATATEGPRTAPGLPSPAASEEQWEEFTGEEGNKRGWKPQAGDELWLQDSKVWGKTANISLGRFADKGLYRRKRTPEGTETPLTDAAEMPIDRLETKDHPQCSIVNADFARNLERQRNEARERAKMAESTSRINFDAFEKETKRAAELAEKLRVVETERETICAHAVAYCGAEWKVPAPGKQHASLIHAINHLGGIARDYAEVAQHTENLRSELARLKQSPAGRLTVGAIFEAFKESRAFKNCNFSVQDVRDLLPHLNARLASPWRDVKSDPPKESDADRNGNVEWFYATSGEIAGLPWNFLDRDESGQDPRNPKTHWRKTDLPPIPGKVDDGFEAWWNNCDVKGSGMDRHVAEAAWQAARGRDAS